MRDIEDTRRSWARQLGGGFWHGAWTVATGYGDFLSWQGPYIAVASAHRKAIGGTWSQAIEDVAADIADIAPIFDFAAAHLITGGAWHFEPFHQDAVWGDDLRDDMDGAIRAAPGRFCWRGTACPEGLFWGRRALPAIGPEGVAIDLVAMAGLQAVYGFISEWRKDIVGRAI